MLSVFKQSTTHTAGRWKTIGRIIMKSKISKLAAAAVIIVAILAGIHHFGGPIDGASIAWADVVKPILNAKGAIFDIIVGEEGKDPVIHDMIMGSRIRRTLQGIDSVSIIDLETSRVLTLDPKESKAVYVDLKGLPSIPNQLEQIQNIITELQDTPGFVVEELGESQIEGQIAVGFKATHPKMQLTIWADPATALPIRIEQEGGQMHAICKNIQFDIDMDETLFSMEVPEGYTLQETELDLFGSTEEDFIEGLRLWTELFGEGYFPASVAVEEYIRQAPMIKEKFEQMELSDEEKLQLGLKLNRYLLFIRFFKGEGKWHYAGNGVKLGDAETAIFWYRPKDSETYRVIYGDLTVEDVEPKNLPQ